MKVIDLLEADADWKREKTLANVIHVMVNAAFPELNVHQGDYNSSLRNTITVVVLDKNDETIRFTFGAGAAFSRKKRVNGITVSSANIGVECTIQKQDTQKQFMKRLYDGDDDALEIKTEESNIIDALREQFDNFDLLFREFKRIGFTPAFTPHNKVPANLSGKKYVEMIVKEWEDFVKADYYDPNDAYMHKKISFENKHFSWRLR